MLNKEEKLVARLIEIVEKDREDRQRVYNNVATLILQRNHKFVDAARILKKCGASPKETICAITTGRRISPAEILATMSSKDGYDLEIKKLVRKIKEGARISLERIAQGFEEAGVSVEDTFEAIVQYASIKKTTKAVYSAYRESLTRIIKILRSRDKYDLTIDVIIDILYPHSGCRIYLYDVAVALMDACNLSIPEVLIAFDEFIGLNDLSKLALELCNNSKEKATKVLIEGTEYSRGAIAGRMSDTPNLESTPLDPTSAEGKERQIPIRNENGLPQAVADEITLAILNCK